MPPLLKLQVLMLHVASAVTQISMLVEAGLHVLVHLCMAS